MDPILIAIALFLYAISLFVFYWVIKTAIRHALISHYKTVRLFEKTGEWQPGSHDTAEPRKLEGVTL
jgi:hypothetical protein